MSSGVPVDFVQVIERKRAPGARREARRSTAQNHRALEKLASIPRVSLIDAPSPVEELTRLRAALGGGPRLFVKRDDAIPFGFGGNKSRKLEPVLAAAVACGADTLVTVGGIQSNHARVTAAAAARLGWHCLLIINGTPQDRPTANAILDTLLGAEIEYIPSRNERRDAMSAAMERLRSQGKRPFEIPLGASTGLGASGFARAVGELLEQCEAPDFIVHATSSAGTQAGLVVGCALHGISTQVIGISADDPAGDIAAAAANIGQELGALLDLNVDLTLLDDMIVDDSFVGEGYGLPTAASKEAQTLAARTDVIFVDHTYTAKALAALIYHVRAGHFRDDDTVLFWHTGGQLGLFAQ